MFYVDIGFDAYSFFEISWKKFCFAITQSKFAGAEFSIASCVAIPVSLIDKKT